MAPLPTIDQIVQEADEQLALRYPPLVRKFVRDNPDLVRLAWLPQPTPKEIEAEEETLP